MNLLSRRRLLGTAAGITTMTIAVGVGAAHEGHDESPTSGASPAASPMASPAASPVSGATTEVAIIDFAFDPAQVEVPLGTTVTWTNEGRIIHTTTDKAREKAWDSKTMESGDTYSHTFTEAGTYEYWCALHPTMLGTVVVTEA